MTLRSSFHYRSFISYCHSDRTAAVRLHRWLERFRVPKQIARIRGIHSLAPVFLDQRDLLPASSLPFEIEQALSASESLIVLCSPAAAASSWVNQEVLFFHRLGRGARTFCVLAGGEPVDAVPPAVFELADEPLAADARGGMRARRRGYRRLAAALLEVPLEALSAPLNRFPKTTAGPVAAPLQGDRDLVRHRQTAAALLTNRTSGDAGLRAGIGHGLDLIATPDVPDGIRAKMLLTLGESYQRLGEFNSALEALTEALALYRRSNTDTMDAARCLHGIALALRDLGREAEALEPVEQALELKRRILGVTNIDLADTLSLHANLLVGAGMHDRGLAIAAEAVTLCSAQPESEAFATSLFDQGTLLRYTGRLEDAEPTLRRAVALHRDLYGRLDARYAVALNAHSLCLRELGELDRAIDGYERVLDVYQHLYSTAHPETARALNNYAVALESRGERNRARKHYELATAQWRATLGDDHPETLGTRHLLARLLLETGHVELAESELDDIIARVDRMEDSSARVLAGHVRVTRAQAYEKAGYPAEAEVLARDAAGRLLAVLPEYHWRTIRAMRIVGEILIGRASFDDADIWIARAESALEHHEHPLERQRVAQARNALSRMTRTPSGHD